METRGHPLEKVDHSQLLKSHYWCFISYRHADNKEPGRQWATWLHQSIETYEVPTDLVGTRNEQGDIIPERIFPVFRDEEELPASAELSIPIEAALQRSHFLLVLCSPQSVDSRWVANEILTFKRSGKENRILAAIIEGHPNGSIDREKPGSHSECFPLPLRYELGEDGQLSHKQTEPIAADFRLPDGNQGWTSPSAYREWLAETGLSRLQIDELVAQFEARQKLMLLKVISGILGVPLGVLTKRDKAYRLEVERRRARVLRKWVMAVSVLAVAAILAGIFAWSKQRESEARRRDAEEQRILAQKNEKKAEKERDVARSARAGADDFISYLQKRVMPNLEASQQQSFAPEIHEKIQLYLDSTAIDPSDFKGGHDRIALFLSRASIAEDEGKLGEAFKHCSTAQNIVNQFLNALEDDEQLKNTENAEAIIRHDSAIIDRRIAQISSKQGQHALALSMFDSAIHELQTVRKKLPLAGWPVVEYAQTEYERGKALLALDREKEAMLAFQNSVTAMEPLARTSQLADAIEDHAIIYAALIKLAEKQAPGSETDLIDAWEKLLSGYKPAEAHFSEYSNAKILYTNVLINKFAKTKEWQKVLREQERQLEFLKERFARQKFPGFVDLAYDTYEKALNVAANELKDSKEVRRLFTKRIDDLTGAVKGTTSSQEVRLMAFSHNAFADFLRESKTDLDLSMHHYLKVLELMELTKPMRKEGPQLQRDLSVAHQRIGLVARLKGDLDEALRQHQQELELAAKAQRLLLERESVTTDEAAGYFCDFANAVHNKCEVLQMLHGRDRDTRYLLEARKLIGAAIKMGEKMEASEKEMASLLDDTRKSLRELFLAVGGSD